MAKRRVKDRLYWREQGGERRAYGDFRDYADLGGRQEALIAPGEKRATMDSDVAQKLISDRLLALDARRRGRQLHGRVEGTRLGAYAAEHLVKKAKAGKVTPDWLAMHELFLTRAVSCFGAERDLEGIGTEDVQRWAAELATSPTARGRRVLARLQAKHAAGRLSAEDYARESAAAAAAFMPSSGTVRHALNALSNLYRRAQSEGKVPPGFNPVAAMLEKPSGVRREARWLEVHHAALLLESARTLPPVPASLEALPAEFVHTLPSAFVHALLATFLLTGGRSAEILGLELDDVSFERQTIAFRPNGWRRLKTLTSARVVPLWPQLEAVLRAYLRGPDRPTGELLFPSLVRGQEAMLTDWRKSLDRVAVRAGWKRGEIRSKMFRHTYCAARLQTVDGGAPVSPFTVSRELGHGSRTMVEEVYSHLGTIRHRAEGVEFRVEQHEEKLRERLAAL